MKTRLSEEGTVFPPLSVISSRSFALLPYYARLSWLELTRFVALYIPNYFAFLSSTHQEKEEKKRKATGNITREEIQFRYHVGYVLVNQRGEFYANTKVDFDLIRPVMSRPAQHSALVFFSKSEK